MKKIKRILIISSDKHLRDVLHFCFDGWGYETFIEDSQPKDISLIKKISPDAIVIDVHSATKPHLEICHLLKDDFTTAFIPVVTLINKRQLREQLLTLKQGVDDYLIKPPDPLDLRTRIEMAIKRAQFSHYASPLTGLPGARLIEDVLREKLEKDTAFSFGHIDIDNFKCFNDAYGYFKGDRVIMQTAYILYTVACRLGDKNDIIGHIGGDDFVFISSPEKYKEFCQYFIIMFDNLIPLHYSEKDRQQGFVIATDRTKKLKKIPLMSVTIAVVNKTKPQEFKNIVELNERIVEIKRYLKTVPGSKFMADRRSSIPESGLEPQIYKKEEKFSSIYEPLGQILLHKKVVSLEQLEEALNLHWKRGVVLGEILKELGYLKDQELNDALSLQKSVLTKKA